MTDQASEFGRDDVGHILPMTKRSRKMMVVVDGSPECEVALRFSAGRAAHIEGGGVVLFHCIRAGEFQHWMAVADRMREEAYTEAQDMLDEMSDRVFAYCSVTPEVAIVEGDPGAAIIEFIEKRDDIFMLTLGASAEGEPGPLVDYFSGPLVGTLKCPLAIIPGNLTYEEIDALV